LKTSQNTPKLKVAAMRPAVNPNSDTSNGVFLPQRGKESFIQWPTKQEIEKVSKHLARIVRAGIRLEATGDYFKSGDLGYQLQEIIRTTAALSRKSQRSDGGA
jgi:hypothetical protein